MLSEFLEKEALSFETEQIFTLAEHAKGKNLNRFDLPPNLEASMDHHDQRFYLLTLGTGFTRRKGNYGGQIAKGVGIGILTMGMFAPIPIKANSGISVMILDNQLGEIAYYKSSFNPEGEPLDDKILSRHKNHLFKGYF